MALEFNEHDEHDDEELEDFYRKMSKSLRDPVGAEDLILLANLNELRLKINYWLGQADAGKLHPQDVYSNVKSTFKKLRKTKRALCPKD